MRKPCGRHGNEYEGSWMTDAVYRFDVVGLTGVVAGTEVDPKRGYCLG